MDSSRSGLLSTLLMTLPLIIVPSIALLRPAGGPAGVAQTVAQGAQTPDDSPDDFFDGLDAVLRKYHLVHEIDRAGSMLDNIIYSNVKLARSMFSPDLLDELYREGFTRQSGDAGSTEALDLTRDDVADLLDHLAAEPVGADPQHHPFGARDHGGAAFREDVDAFVLAAAAAGAARPSGSVRPAAAPPCPA